MLLGGNLLTASSLLVASVVVEVPFLLATAFIAGVAQSVVLVTYITMRTAFSPDELLGRIGSTARTISLGQPVGLLTGGALLDLLGGSRVPALMGLAVAGVSLLFALVRPPRSASLPARQGRPWQSGGAIEVIVPDGRICDVHADLALTAARAAGSLASELHRFGAPWALDADHVSVPPGCWLRFDCRQPRASL